MTNATSAVSDPFFTVFVVTNTQDSGPGSLRQAILDLNATPGPNSVAFNIPTNDLNFVGYQDNGITGTYDPDLPVVPVGSGVDPDGPQWWRITVDSSLPVVTSDGMLIDGSSQRFNQGDKNPFGPEIEVVRSAAVWITTGLVFNCDANLINELIINNFGETNLQLNGNSNQLQGSYIGIEPGGANSTAHITSSDNNIYVNGNDNTIGGLAGTKSNLVSGNGQIGIFVQGNDNQIIANYIGVNRQVTEVVGGALAAIQIWGGSNNLIAFNIIGGGAITLEFPGPFQTTIRNNYIGTDSSGMLNLAGLTYFGAIEVVETSSNNIIGPDNVIKNHQRGIVILGEEAVNNTITRNSISNNQMEGIRLNFSNSGIQAPTITLAGAGYVVGTAPPQTMIEIFSDTGNQGAVYEGVTQTDGEGDFIWFGIPEGPNITATATDSSGNTSEFSAPYSVFSIWIPLVLN